MMLRNIILHNSFDETESSFVVMRTFQLQPEKQAEHLVLTGNDFDDHEIWILQTETAELVGTLSENSYKHLRRTKNLILFIGDSSFIWLENKVRFNSTLTGKFVSSSILRDIYTYVQILIR